jgi:hypothetical protein
VKKFEHPFDYYEVVSERPMSLELNPQGVKRYMHLFNHPIYYLYALQFLGGNLFRAILGYENLWDLPLEEKLVHDLDKHLCDLAEKELYYLEEIEFKETSKFFGTRWPKGVKRPVIFTKQKWKRVERGCRALARVNLIDKPNHVDIEFSNGEVWSIYLMHYLNLKKYRVRSLDHADKPKPKQNGNDEKNGERGEAPKAKSACRLVAVKAVDVKLPRLRQRFRRSHSLR